MTAPYVLLGNEGQSAAHRAPSILEFQPSGCGSPRSVIISTSPFEALEKQEDLRDGRRANNDEQDYPPSRAEAAADSRPSARDSQGLGESYPRCLKVIDIFRDDE